MGYQRYGLPKREQDLSGGWKPLVQRCACGVEKCVEASRHNFKALVTRCLKEPKWVDPAPFRVPSDASGA